MSWGRRLEDLGTPALRWADLRAYVKHSLPSSALGRELGGEAAAYTPTDHFLHVIVHQLAHLEWQLVHALGGNGKEPEYKALPGGKENKPDGVRRGDVMTIEELDERLGWDK